MGRSSTLVPHAQSGLTRSGEVRCRAVSKDPLSVRNKGPGTDGADPKALPGRSSGQPLEAARNGERGRDDLCLVELPRESVSGGPASTLARHVGLPAAAHLHSGQGADRSKRHQREKGEHRRHGRGGDRRECRIRHRVATLRPLARRITRRGSFALLRVQERACDVSAGLERDRRRCRVRVARTAGRAGDARQRPAIHLRLGDGVRAGLEIREGPLARQGGVAIVIQGEVRKASPARREREVLVGIRVRHP